MTDERRSAQDLVRFLRGRGLTNAEIAAELDRSPRMVSKILNGETRGELYRTTLEELATTGRSTTVPPRRRTKSGELVKVRAGGGEEKSVTPVDTGGTYAEKRQGGRFRSSTTYLAGGGRQYELGIPKGKTAKGRDLADQEIIAKVRAAAKGQARDKQKQISARVTWANGRTMELNNYNASTMLQRIREGGGSALEWMRSESGLRY
jgi:transcriptional regulator with XRE-family HTH domain